MTNFEVWLEELNAMDNLEGHQKVLAELELDYLATDAADCKRTRLETIWLLRHFAKLLKT